MSTSHRTHICIGLLLLGVALAFYFWIIPWQIADASGRFGMSPRVLPRLLGGLLGLFSAMLCLAALFQRNRARHGNPLAQSAVAGLRWDNLKWVLALTVTGFLYVYVIDILGFLLASMCAMAAFLLLFNERRYPLVVVLSLLIPLSLQGLFQNVLRVFLPRGVLQLPF